jgi:acyl dehydratase
MLRGDGAMPAPQASPGLRRHCRTARRTWSNLPTRPDQAFLYRLNGDPNPLHVEPDAARAAG